MSSTSKKWFVGCGIGCGLFLLVGAGVGIFGFMAVKDVVKRTDNISESYDVLVETFGSPEEFIPQLDGSIPPSRVEVFLETRRNMAPSREALSRILFVLQGEMDDYESSGASKLELLKSGIGFLPALFNFMESRNVAMVEEGMGPGEYMYIYSLAYFGLLEKDEGDGPALAIKGDAKGDDHNGGFQWQVGNGRDEEGVSRDERSREVRSKLNRLLGEVLSNQLLALQNSGAALDDPAVLALKEEMAAMGLEKLRLIWEEGLPLQIRSSLEPFSEELDELYDPIMNAVEIIGPNDN